MHLYFDKIWKMSGWLGCSVTPQCLPWHGNCWNTSVNVHSEVSFTLSQIETVLTKKEASAQLKLNWNFELPTWTRQMPLEMVLWSNGPKKAHSWMVWHDWESQQEIYVKHTSKLLLQRIKQGNIRLFPKNIRQTMTEACWWLPKILVGCINSIYCFKVVYILLTSCGREKIQTKFKLEHTSNILLVIKDVLCTIIPEKSIIQSPKLPRLSCPWWVHANCWPQLYIE